MRKSRLIVIPATSLPDSTIAQQAPAAGDDVGTLTPDKVAKVFAGAG
jgi:hypothetical protein